jgi:hypothetical protein
MSKAITTAKSALAAASRQLSDASGHLSDLRTALRALGRETGGFDPISQAVAAHQAATTPAAIRKAVNACKGRGYDGMITPGVIRRSAAADLQAAVEREVLR